MNSLIFTGVFDSPKVVMQKDVTLLFSFQEAQLSTSMHQHPSVFVTASWLWLPPILFSFKTNWDASFIPSSRCGGLGGVTQDSNNDVIACFSCIANNTLNYEVAEALVLRKAMFICAELGLHSMTFEGDCQSVINMINSISSPSSFVTSIIVDIHQLLLNFPYWYVVFSHRETKMVAHHLAKLACSIFYDDIWVDECPSNVMSFVMFDKHCILPT